jgi:hypothetical protein
MQGSEIFLSTESVLCVMSKLPRVRFSGISYLILSLSLSYVMELVTGRALAGSLFGHTEESNETYKTTHRLQFTSSIKSFFDFSSFIQFVYVVS